MLRTIPISTVDANGYMFNIRNPNYETAKEKTPNFFSLAHFTDQQQKRIFKDKTKTDCEAIPGREAQRRNDMIVPKVERLV